MIIAAQFIAINLLTANLAMVMGKFVIAFFFIASHLNQTPVKISN